MKATNSNSRLMRFCLSFALLFVALLSYGQNKHISGVITDTTGETVISASIVVKGTTIGTVSDFDGNYELDVPADAKILEVSFIGMQTQEVPITGSVINVVLAEDNKVLEEVVVTGYGQTKKRDLVTSVASVGSEQLKDIPVTSASEALQGKLAGVQVTASDGAADAEINIRVRGGTSITQSNEPLYIVDGFPVSSIADIAPGDIQSMDVLKDAAATAIYGAQGANGVIIITTKDSDTDSDKMTFHIDYTGYVGWKRMAKKYDMMKTRDYVLMQYEYALLSGKTDKFYELFDHKIAREHGDTGKPTSKEYTSVAEILDHYTTDEPYYDWQRVTFGPTWGEGLRSGSAYEDGNEGYYEHQGFTSNHSISLTGGNKNANFNLSYSRIDDKGIMYGSNYARNNISFKAKFKPVKNLTIGVTTRFSNTQSVGPGANTNEDAGSTSESRVRNAVAYTPTYLRSTDEEGVDYDSFGSLYDPITTIDHNYKYKKDNKWTLNGYISYKFAKHFTIKSELGFEMRNRDQNRLYGPTTYYSRDGDGKTNADNVPYLNHVQVTDQRNQKLRNTNTFEYKNKWGQHNFDVLIGEEQTWNKGETQLFYGYGYDKELTYHNIFNYLNDASNKDLKNTVNSTDNMLSFFARANYNYKGRYYVTATFRADCSTRFTRGNQWGYFPSAALAWRMSDEEWMQGASDWLSNLKIRFSYGTAGNNNVETGYLYYVYYSATDSYMSGFDTNRAYTIGGSDKIAPNPKLKWETTHTRNLGIDYGFFNERLSGSLDLYWNTTKDLILRYALSGRGGYDNQYRNIGSTENKGIEFAVKGVILDHKSTTLSYGLTADANIAFNFNKVIDLGGLQDYTVSTNCFSGYYQTPDEFRLEEGESMGIVYGYKTAGWFTPDDFDAYDYKNDQWLVIDPNGAIEIDGQKYSTVAATVLNGSTKPARPGLTKLVKSDGTLAQGKDDRVNIGNTLPLFTGGFNISAYVGGDKWGKVDFSANFTYSYGNDIVNMTNMDLSTVVESTWRRNLTANAAYGNRYSLFSPDGQYLPQASTEGLWRGDAIEIPNIGRIINWAIIDGDNYQVLKNTLAQANAGASMANPVQNSTALTDQYVEDGSYLRFQNLTIGYSFPKVWMEKAHLTNVRVFFQATNLFCVSPYSGPDPEVNTRASKNPMAIGVDYSAYPKNRGFNVGVNFQF